MENEGSFVVKELAWSSRDLERAFVQSTWLCIRAFVWSRAGSRWYPGAALQGMGSRQDTLDKEPDSGQSLVAPHHPSPPARRCRSSPGQAWGHQAVPGVSTADVHPGLGRVTSAPQTCPAPIYLVSRPKTPGASVTSTTCSTHTPLVERGVPFSSVPFPGTHPNPSNVPLPLHSFFQGSSAALPVSLQLPDSSSR